MSTSGLRRPAHEASPRHDFYRFDEYELDPKGFELRRNSVAVHIEPRVLEVLLHLVQNRGRVVSKEELLDQVWQKSFVTESALTRCIMEARKAIGDPSRAEPLIKTVHGRGYRFEDAQGSSLPAERHADVAEPAAVAIPERRRRRFAPIGALLALAVVLGAAAVLLFRRDPPALPRTIAGVALLPISTTEDDRELQLVGMSLNDLLESRLRQIERLRVRGADYSKPLSLDSKNLVDVADRAGADAIISGSARLNEAGDKAHLVLTLHLVRGKIVNDTPLGSFDIPLLRSSADIDAYASTRERVARAVVATLLPAIEVPSAEGPLTPRNFEAYRLYLLARARLSAGACDGETALELLRRSLEIDDRFAPAWELYGWSQYGLASSCSDDSSHYTLAQEAADRALQLAPNMGSAIGLKACVMTETGRIEEAYEVLKSAEQRSPDSPDVKAFLFYVLQYAGYLDDARRHLDRVIELDPLYLTEGGWTPNPYLYLGDTDRFLALLPGTDSPVFRYYRGIALLAAGRNDEAKRAIEPAFRLNPSDVFARLSQSLLASLEGRRAEGAEIARHLARQRADVGASDGEVTYKIAQLLALGGDPDRAFVELDRAVSQGFVAVDYMQRDPLMASLRSDPRWAPAMARAEQRHHAFGARAGLLSSRGVRRPSTS